jgi:hypothetical protein
MGVRAKWTGECCVAGNPHGSVSPAVRKLMQQIFACGNYMTVEEYNANGGVTLKDIMDNPWFQEDLPEGAMNMREECIKKTKERLQSSAYIELRENLVKAGLAVGVEQSKMMMERSTLKA